ncbi:MAG: magnesium transporter, partial [Verrucomicrobiales bacterium]
VFESLDDLERGRFAEYISNEAIALIVSFLPPAEAVDLLNSLKGHEQSEILNDLPDDVTVDLLQEFDPAERQAYFLKLSDHKKEIAKNLLQFPEESAGGRMTTAMATVRADMTVREAIDALAEKREETELLARIYVVDELGHILGKVRLRDLTFNPIEMRVCDFMDDEQIAINANADQEEAVQMMTKYDLVALPVTDDDNRLLGIITYDDALEIQEEESTEDIQMAAAISGSQEDEGYYRSPILTQFKRRFAWVFFLAILAILSGLIIYSYERLLDNYFLLAVFMPMIVATGGNTGAQAATMVIRAMSLGEFTPGAFAPIVWKELRIGLLMGALLGLFVALGGLAIIYYFLEPAGKIDIPVNYGQIMLVVGLSLTAQVGCSTLLGAVLPMLASALKLDPAIVASPAITTAVDVLGLFIYFGLAKMLLGI